MVMDLLKRFAQASMATHTLVLTAVALAALALLKTPGMTWLDLFMTADQQGRWQFERKEYRLAAERFTDPAWRGTAQYRGGQYAEAADSFGQLGSAEGFFNRGNAYMRAFDYRRAVVAYEQAVAEAPDWREASENLALARYTLAYVEQARADSDTGEERGIGADDVVYDNSGTKGEDTEVTRESAVEAQSAEKWMRSVDTETADFLRSRFLLEADRRGER